LATAKDVTHTNLRPGQAIRDFSKGSILQHLVVFSLPMLLGNLLQILYSTVDSIWVGRFLGPGSLAAVSVSLPLVFALVSLIVGLAMAATTMISQYAGAGDHQMVSRTITNSLRLLGLMGLAASVVGVVFRVPLLGLVNTPPEILPQAQAYFGVFMGGLVTMFLYNVYAAIMRGLGDSRTPVVYLFYATTLNIVLDPIFIFGFGPIPAMGVAGAAAATVLSQALSAYLGFRHMLVRLRLFRLDRRLLVSEPVLTRQMLRIGLPAGLQQTMVALGMVVMSSIINTFGPMVVAAFGAAGRLDQFAFLPAMTLSQSVSALVGQNIGAGKDERVRETVRWTSLMVTGISLAVTALVWLLPFPLLRLFTVAPEVLAEGARYLRIVGLSYVFLGLMFTLAGVMRGAGDTLPTMLITLVALWFVRVPLAVYLSKPMGSTGIQVAMAVSPVVGFALSLGYYLTGRWRHKAVTAGPS